MATLKVPKPTVEESSHYENLMNSSELVDGNTQPSKPKVKGNPYPFKLKIHTWTLGDTKKFSVLMRRPLSSDKKGRTFVYKKEGSGYPENTWGYTENRSNPFPKRTSHKNRLEAELWKNTMEFVQDGWNAYLTFEVTFKTGDDYLHFCRTVKQKLSLNSKAMTFPQRKPRVYKFGWKSKWSDPNPTYPIYIVSKGRGDSRLTSKTLERLKVPYYIVIERQDYDEYSCMIDPKKILVLPFSNHGDGPGRSRNWCWDHSNKMGFKRHWVMDDNINGFLRLHRNRKFPVLDGGMFRVCEEFVDRFKNVPVAGLQYSFFCVEKASYPPFVLNTRIYSCLLIENSCRHRWRGRYNEDTILSLDVLKDKMCVLQFNNLIQRKIGTQIMGGGNTSEFYGREGTYNKSKMLQDVHPDVSEVVWKYGRFHHHVKYESFRNNTPEFIDDYNPEDNRLETDLFEFERIKIN